MTRALPDPRSVLVGAFRAAVDAARPAQTLDAHLPAPPAGRLVVVGAGKAAAAMAARVEEHYADRHRDAVVEGVVVTRYGHALPTRRVEVVEASHPVPDAAGVAATERILELLRGVGANDRVLCLISGGGSALLCAPEGVDLEQKAALTEALLRSGAEIGEMNTVRKHLSRVKGGRLAAAAAPTPLLALVLSDVVGDDLSTIASGPTVPDPTRFEDALAVLDRYAIEAPAARRRFEAGLAGRVEETPKPGSAVFRTADTRLIGSGQQSLEAAADHLERHGIAAHILASTVTGEAREAAAFHAAVTRQVVEFGQPFAPPCALLSGGETTVTVRGRGRGGRNSEFGLALALALPESDRIFALAADTDGIDGSEDNAGVLVSPALLGRLTRARARELLDANDSYRAFLEADLLLVTGPTRTNVNDLRIVLVL